MLTKGSPGRSGISLGCREPQADFSQGHQDPRLPAVELQGPFQCRQGLRNTPQAVLQAAQLRKKGRLSPSKGFGLLEFPVGLGRLALPQENRTPGKVILKSLPVGPDRCLSLVEDLQGPFVVAAPHLNAGQAQLRLKVGLQLQSVSQVGFRLVIIPQMIIAETQDSIHQGILAILPDFGQEQLDGSTIFPLLVVAQSTEPVGGGGKGRHPDRSQQAQGDVNPQNRSSPQGRGMQKFHGHSATR